MLLPLLPPFPFPFPLPFPLPFRGPDPDPVPVPVPVPMLDSGATGLLDGPLVAPASDALPVPVDGNEDEEEEDDDDVGSLCAEGALEDELVLLDGAAETLDEDADVEDGTG